MLGFELHRVENCGVHYARTIELWHRNWQKNKDKVIGKYKTWWYRNWDVFLAWSALIARQGTSAVYMMTVTKNTFQDAHSIKINSNNKPLLNRTQTFIGPKTIAWQQ